MPKKKPKYYTSPYKYPYTYKYTHNITQKKFSPKIVNTKSFRKFKKFIITTKKRYNTNIKNTFSLANLSVKLLEKFSPKLNWPTAPNKIQKQINSSYKGGNIFLNKNKCKRTFFYDVNSLYPFCFINKLPVGYPKIVYNPEISSSFGFIEAKVTPPNYILNNLLLLNLIEKKTSWNIFFSEELKLAEKLGYTIITKKAYTYKYTHNITQDFLLHIYQNKGFYRKNVKTILNNLYGKLAENHKNSTYSPLTTTAAAVTSYGRIYMYNLINKTNNPLIYSDTDSLILQHPYTHNITHHNKLGLLKNSLKRKNTKSFATNITIEKKRIYKFTYNNILHKKGYNFTAPNQINPHSWIYINNKPIAIIQIITYNYHNYKTRQLDLSSKPNTNFNKIYLCTKIVYLQLYKTPFLPLRKLVT